MAFFSRPMVMGRRGVVTSGHYLASAAGFRMMEQGGNAIDAAAAMGFCLAVLEPHQNGLGGEVPIIVYSARDGQVHAISGVGWTPAAFTIDWCRTHGIEMIPGDGYLPACVPAVVGTWAAALARFGTMSFSQILQPAIELAEGGFAMYDELHGMIASVAELFRTRYPSSAQVYLPGGRVPEVGEVFRNPDVAGVLKRLCRAEAAARANGRAAAIEAAARAFYHGEIADRIVDFIARNPVADASGSEHAGLLTADDIAQWQAAVEPPLSVDYRGLTVHKCSSWTQGPVFLQQLTILEGFDLKAMGACSADYIHTWIECAKLAFADREAYYGDPLLDRVPFDVLLSKDYAARRRSLIGPAASMELRPGDAGAGVPDYATFDVLADNRRGLHSSGDTTHLDAIDSQGNMVAATPSGGWIQSSPVIAGLGFPLGTRGQMFYLDARRPNALAPHKRPRATLTPTMVTRNGKPLMAFGTPGGDCQDQWTLQFFINHVDFGMDVQAALDAPEFATGHFTSSFYPRGAAPGWIGLDRRIPQDVIDELARRGHVIGAIREDPIKMMGIVFDADRGVIRGGVRSTGGVTCAMGW
ncbi:MAG TPA: gamma-glutamyltransferase family protein [Planctomycetota bacterium]|nr:gamma-glutamyltransferase family protein [Planctomycetota bacterium]